MPNIHITIVAWEGDARKLASYLNIIADELRGATKAVLKDTAAGYIGAGVLSLVVVDNLPRIQVIVTACHTHEREYVKDEWRDSLIMVMRNLHKIAALSTIRDLLLEDMSVQILLPPGEYAYLPAQVLIAASQ